MCWNGLAAGDGSDHSSKEISNEGDWGMNVFDGSRDPLAMHHAILETKVGVGPILYKNYLEPLTCIIKAHQSFFPDVSVSENNDNLNIQQISPQKRASCLVLQIDASFLAKRKTNFKEETTCFETGLNFSIHC